MLTVSNTNDAGAGSLRQAITAANAQAGQDTIGFDLPGVGPHTVQLEAALPDLSDFLSLVGPIDESVTVRGEGSAEIYSVFRISPGQTVSFSRLTISNGSGSLVAGVGSGGGIYNAGGTLNLSHCTFSANAAGDGGAIFNSLGRLNVANCTFSGNSAGNKGGAIYNEGNGSGATDVDVINCTFSGNSASFGGGIWNYDATSSRGIVRVGNSIFQAGASGANLVNSGGRILTFGYNLSSDGSGPNNGTTDRININAQLEPLGDNGGPTPTHALQSTSPAIDAGNSTLPTDQRGRVRPFDVAGVTNASNGSDIGAVEQNSVDAIQTGPTFIVNTTANSDGACTPLDCSLREAIAASDGSFGATTIAFNIPAAQGQNIDGDAEADVWTLLIDPLPFLPAITKDNSVIDGRTQSTFIGGNPNASGPEIVVQAINRGQGLKLMAANGVIRDLALGGFTNAIVINGNSNLVAGCFIGVDATGTQAMANQEGIVVTGANNRIGGTNVADRNIIGFTTSRGIHVQGAAATGNRIQGNYIGLGPDGSTPIPNSSGIHLDGARNTLVGGDNSGARNVISANTSRPIVVGGDNNSIIDNYFNTDATGNVRRAAANSFGISIEAFIAGSSALNNLIARNIICGGQGEGVVIRGANVANNVLEGNNIGIGADNTTLLDTNASSQGSGVILSSSNNRIGGSGVGQGNRIAGNGTDGVWVTGNTAGNAIQGNAIYANGNLGINLGNDGITANDAGDGDSGPNGLQNFPVIANARREDSNLVLNGTLDSLSNTSFIIELFLSDEADPTFYGEGQFPIGSTTVTTDGAGAAAWTLSVPLSSLPGGTALNRFASATATRLDTSDPQNPVARDTSEFSFVQRVNNAPVGVDDSATTDEETPILIAVAANDSEPDGDDWYVLEATAGANTHGTLSLRSNNQILYTPDVDFFGTATFTYTLQDVRGARSTATVTVTVRAVNDAPSFVKGANVAVDEDAGAQTIANFLTSIRPGPANESGQSVSFVVSHNNASLFAMPPAIAPNGTLTFTPAPNASGSATVSIQARDNGGVQNGGVDASATQTFVITVRAVNDAPVNTVPGAQSTLEDVALVFNTPNSNRISVADADAGSQTVRVTLTVTNGTLTLSRTTGLTFSSGDGTSDATMSFSGTLTAINAALDGLNFTPTANFNGAASLVITTNDLGNTGAGGAKEDTDTVAIAVTPINDAPIAVNDAFTVTQSTLSVASPGVLINDSDIDNPTLRAVLVSGPSRGTVVLNADGSFVYTPQAGYNGEDVFTYQASDGQNGTATATVTLTVRAVNDVNDAPIAQDQSTSTGEEMPKTIVLSATDADNTNLTFTLVTPPARGTLSGSGANLTYTPNVDFVGRDSFTFKASDGALESNVATVTIDVGGSNDAPVAVEDAFAVSGAVALQVAAPGVLGNDSDNDSTELTVELISPVRHGTLSLQANGGFSYTPFVGYNGLDSFTYRVSDGALNSNTVTVTLTISGNIAPALSFSIAQSTLDENAMLQMNRRVTRGRVLRNNSGPALTVRLVSNDATELRVPPTVVIPAGQTFAEFPLIPVDDVYADGARVVTISARADGYANAATAQITVRDNEVPTLSASVAPGRIAENGSVTLTVRRNSEITAATPALRVSLSGLPSRQLTVPSSVTIPARAASVSVRVAAIDDRVVDGSRVVTVTAKATGFLSGLADVIVMDNESASSGSIRGRVLLAPGVASTAMSRAPVPGVVLTLRQGRTLIDRVVTAANGTYDFSRVPAGTYSVTPTKVGYTFAPASRSVTLNGAATAASGLDFSGTPRAQISGLVYRLDADGARISLNNVVVIARSLSASAPSLQVRTNSGGRYLFDRTMPGTYVVAPLVPGTAFKPNSHVVNLTPASPLKLDADFVAAGVDSAAPTVRVTQPTASSFSQTTKSTLSVAGNAADGRGSGLAAVTVALARFASATATVPNGFLHWNRRSFITTDNVLLVEALARSTAAWTLTDADALSSLRTLPAGFYGLRATAVDNAGNVARSSWKRFRIEPPTIAVPRDQDVPDEPEAGAESGALSQVRLSSAAARVDRSEIVLLFTGELEVESASAAANYRVTVNGKMVVVESIFPAQRGVRLGLPEGALQSGDTLTVTWPGLRDARGLSLNRETATIVLP